MAHGAQSTHDRLDILDACPYGLVEDPTVLIHDHRRPPVVQQPHRSEHKGPHEDASHPPSCEAFKVEPCGNVPMFCPQCGTLAFPDPTGNIMCPNYQCDYRGSASNTIVGTDGQEIDLAKASSTSKVAKRKYEVIPDSSELKGVLTTGNYICPKCDGNEVFVELVQTRSSDEPETRILTCKGCKHGWREY